MSEREREKKGEREEQAHLVVFEHVLTISLRTNESASDLSREIYSFIHRERMFFFFLFSSLPTLRPSGDSLLRRSVHMGNLSRSACASATRVCVRKLSRIPTNLQCDRPRDLLAASAYLPRNPPLNRDLPECLRKEAAISRTASGSPSYEEARRVNLIAATYRE